jgi:signal transduction histidine kinase
VADAVDPDGKHYGQEELALIKTKGSGWVDYKYNDPVTKKQVEKSFYIQKVDDQIFLGCGVYKR